MNHNFKPAWWLRNGHLQTLWPTFCRKSLKSLAIRRERFELADGDFVDLDWIGEGNGPIVLILHGLEGSIDSSYAKGMMQAIQRQGWRGVFMHFRGCSGECNRTLRSYHSGETADVAAVVAWLKSREPTVPLAAIGFSLGGNVLLKWLGETHQHNPLAAAIAISVPFEVKKSVKRINQGFSRLYQWHLLKRLQRKMQTKQQQHPFPAHFPSVLTLRSIYEFDNKITAPMNGFVDADDYYAKSSSRQYLHAISVPTLLLQAKDDPFMTDDLLPHQTELAPKVILEMTEGGGHVGFVSGKLPWRAEYWLEQRVPLFLREHLPHL